MNDGVASVAQWGQPCANLTAPRTYLECAAQGTLSVHHIPQPVTGHEHQRRVAAPQAHHRADVGLS